MENRHEPEYRTIYLIGAKSVGHYGGYESFAEHLLEEHRENTGLRYCILTKANGEGAADGKADMQYPNAEIIEIPVPQIGHVQAVVYDIRAWKYCLRSIREHGTKAPVIYVLGCRRWLTFPHLVKAAHALGGTVLVNPDGMEWKRTKWSRPVRLYLKLCQRLMVREADAVVCDSRHMQASVPNAARVRYIAYGADLTPSALAENSPEFRRWLEKYRLTAGAYYLSCGRLVPENNYEIMLREYMKSGVQKPLVLLTTENDRYLRRLNRKLRWKDDPRIRFASPVYDGELLKKIRENAFGSIHGHSVGGTNPSLLEALASTDVNLVYDVCFNREAAGDGALYWTREDGSLAALLEQAEALCSEERNAMGERAKARIRTAYTWERVAAQYEALFTENRRD